MMIGRYLTVRLRSISFSIISSVAFFSVSLLFILPLLQVSSVEHTKMAFKAFVFTIIFIACHLSFTAGKNLYFEAFSLKDTKRAYQFTYCLS